MARGLSQCMAQEMKSITIAGGGLAGLALGIALRRVGVPVTLHEALRYPRHRVCGEFISGVSDETLASLGIDAALAPAHRPQQVRWWSGSHFLSHFSLPEPARALSRYALDEVLSRQFRALGGEICENSRVAPVPAPGLVWTAGRRPARGPWIGLKAHVRDLDLDHSLEMHLGSHGYVGLVAVEDGWVNVCGLFRLMPDLARRSADFSPPVLPSDPARSSEPLLLTYLRHNGLEDLATRLQRVPWREQSESAVAGFRLGLQPPLPGLMSLGDAHSIIPPFTGNGMSMALEAAALAVPPLQRYARGEIDWDLSCALVRQTARRAFTRRLSLAGTCQGLLLAPWFRRPLEILAQEQLLPFSLLFSHTRR